MYYKFNALTSIMKKHQGFSLIEIMVVVMIIGFMAAAVSINLLGKADQAKVKQVSTDIKTIKNALSMYKLDNHVFPSDEQGLEALVDMPTLDPVPKQWQEGGYLDKMPLDPWDRPYIYVIPGENGRPYEVYSLGADGRVGGEGYDKDLYE